MNKPKSPDERFLDAQIALLMEASPEELDEYLVAVGLDPQDVEKRGLNAVKGALTNLQVAKQAADLSDLSSVRQREIAGRLRIKRSVFAALAEHRAIVSSIPKRFMEQLANEIGATAQVLSLVLSAPVVGTRAARYKSDTRPQPPVRVPFEQLLREAAMSEEEIGELLREDG
ncbi:MAG: hypothetical protein ACYCSN_14975 [Acidobacteriaceae bacterium]